MAHWLLRYVLAPDYPDRRAAWRADHLALAWAAADAGALLLGGAVGDDSAEALLLFAGDDGAAAAAFARVDPYVIHGLVTRWTVQPWATVVGAAAAMPLR